MGKIEISKLHATFAEKRIFEQLPAKKAWAEANLECGNPLPNKSSGYAVSLLKRQDIVQYQKRLLTRFKELMPVIREEVIREKK